VADASEFSLTTFARAHANLEGFATEVRSLAGSFQLFNSRYELEDAYGRLMDYVAGRLGALDAEIAEARR
jgi:hypothetical protein